MKNYLQKQSPIFLLCTFLLLLFLGLHCASIAVTASFDHDEHQFITSGALLLREGLLPYLDYPYFQLPNLSFIYAFAFLFSDHLLLTARFVSAISFFTLLAFIYFQTIDVLKKENLWLKILTGVAALGFLIPNTVVLYTAGKSWNHSLPLLLTFVAYVIFIKSWKNDQFKKQLFWSGFWLSLAIGTRISFASLVFPFFFGIFFFTHLNWVQKRVAIFSFSIGGIIGMLPSILLFLATPQAFLFDVLNYHLEVDTQYFLASDGGLDLKERWNFFYRNITIGRNWHLTRAAIIFFTAAVLINIKQKKKLHFVFVFTALLIPFSILSSFSKTVIFYQYFFAPLPFIIMMMVFAITSLPQRFQKIGIGLFCLLSSLTLLKKDTSFWKIPALFETEKWVPLKIHQEGAKIAEMCDDGQVLTLAPILPLEGKKQIYPSFATGPFAWRTSSFVSLEDRKRSKIISVTELESYLEKSPPIGILTGYEWKKEDEFICYARKNGYDEHQFKTEKSLFYKAKNTERAIIIEKDFENDTTVFYLKNKFSPNLESSFLEIKEKPPFKIFSSIQVFSETTPQTDSLCLVLEIRDGKNEVISWKGRRVMECEWENENWNSLEIGYTCRDSIFQNYSARTYLWNIAQQEIWLKDFKIEVAKL